MTPQDATGALAPTQPDTSYLSPPENGGAAPVVVPEENVSTGQIYEPPVSEGGSESGLDVPVAPVVDPLAAMGEAGRQPGELVIPPITEAVVAPPPQEVTETVDGLSSVRGDTLIVPASEGEQGVNDNVVIPAQKPAELTAEERIIQDEADSVPPITTRIKFEDAFRTPRSKLDYGLIGVGLEAAIDRDTVQRKTP